MHGIKELRNTYTDRRDRTWRALVHRYQCVVMSAAMYLPTHGILPRQGYHDGATEMHGILTVARSASSHDRRRGPIDFSDKRSRDTEHIVQRRHGRASERAASASIHLSFDHARCSGPLCRILRWIRCDIFSEHSFDESTDCIGSATRSLFDVHAWRQCGTVGAPSCALSSEYLDMHDMERGLRLRLSEAEVA